jgi:hypothetical protein
MIPKNSPLIALPFTHVRGDTGSPERAIREFDCKSA